MLSADTCQLMRVVFGASLSQEVGSHTVDWVVGGVSTKRKVAAGHVALTYCRQTESCTSRPMCYWQERDVHNKRWTYSAFGKYSDPSTFFTFCYVSLILKWILLFFSDLISLHTISHNDKAKTVFFCKCKKKRGIYISIQTLSVLCWITFGSVYILVVWCYKLGTPVFAEFLFHSSLQILSSFVRLDGKWRCTAIFRSL